MEFSRRFVSVVLIATFLTGAAAGLAVGYARWHRTWDPFEFRRWVSLNRAEAAPRGGVLVVGDSIVEQQHLPDLCGLPAFNVGLSSSRSRDHAPMVADLVATVQPKWVVIASGTNDVGLTPRTPLAEWTPVVSSMIDAAGPRAIVVGITASKETPLADQYNQELERIVVRAGGRYVDPIPTSQTKDGLHLNARGRQTWKSRVERACSSSLPEAQ